MTDEVGEAMRGFAISPLEELTALGVDSVALIPENLLDRLRNQFLLDDVDYQLILQRFEEAKRQRDEVKNAF